MPAILYKVNMQTFIRIHTGQAQLNDIVRVRLKTAQPLSLDLYQANRATAPVAPPVAFSI